MTNTKFNLQFLGDRMTWIIKSYNMPVIEFLWQNNLTLDLIDNIRKGIVPDGEVIYDFAVATNSSVDYLLGHKDENVRG